MAANEYDRAMLIIGRFMQIFALVLLPAAMVAQLVMPDFRSSQLLVALIFGAAMFYLGRMLEGIARSDADKLKRRDK